MESNGKDMKKNWLLVVGIAIPVAVVVAVVASIYVPRFFVHPRYNFVYSENASSTLHAVCTPNTSDDTAAPTVSQLLSCSAPDVKVYLYNVASNTSTELTITEKRTYTLNADETSPDGFAVNPPYSSGGEPFFGTSYNQNNVYITKGTYSHKLNISQNTTLDFQFLGWVKN